MVSIDQAQDILDAKQRQQAAMLARWQQVRRDLSRASLVGLFLLLGLLALLAHSKEAGQSVDGNVLKVNNRTGHRAATQPAASSRPRGANGNFLLLGGSSSGMRVQQLRI